MATFDERTRELLSEVPLFEGLSRKELESILQTAKDVNVDAGKKIVEQGDNGVGFHLILEGACKVTVHDHEVATLGRGDYFGEMSLIDGDPRSATVVAETPVRTLSLTSWTFLPLLEQNPSVARKLLVEMSRRLRVAERSIKH
ncbi:MAG TPA: cyclic nucleotide-binding domain-containing protein [Actinomycetota bacterium]|nr:cyclic nucleotide-binding domain-containing protein [Actinomycetota bacterium]